MYYLLKYDFVENFENARKPFRDNHLKLVDKYFDLGLIIAAGAVGSKLDSGLIIFKVSNEDRIKEFINSDPYHKNSLVINYDIKPWHIIKIGV